MNEKTVKTLRQVVEEFYKDGEEEVANFKTRIQTAIDRLKELHGASYQEDPLKASILFRTLLYIDSLNDFTNYTRFKSNNPPNPPISPTVLLVLVELIKGLAFLISLFAFCTSIPDFL